MSLLGFLILLLVLAVPQPSLASTSVFQSMPDDPRAVVLKAVGDGRADDSAAIQEAIDRAGK
jgi:hypothetical protein